MGVGEGVMVPKINNFGKITLPHENLLECCIMCDDVQNVNQVKNTFSKSLSKVC